MAETLTFEAETQRVLELVVRSLYSEPGIFLRELISNASDALDRLRIEVLQNAAFDDGSAREIVLEVDPAKRTLTVRDSGIGMSYDEVIQNLGTIARSGSREALEQLRREGRSTGAGDFIGQFGVGFYSAFIVADRVVVTTRRAGETGGTRWESAGDAHYQISRIEEVPKGTAVTLHLKDVDPESGIDDFTDRWALTRIVKRYSDFVTHPIVYVGPDAEPSDGAPDEPAEELRVVLNTMKPIWTRPASSVTREEFSQFFTHISNDWNEPLLRMSFKGEGRYEQTALLYVPAQAPHDLFYHAAPYGLQLYSQRVLIRENCTELVPRYLRFLKGVVDASDLPLNVSRQDLQNVHHLAAIRRWISKKSIESLSQLHNDEPAKFFSFWQHFGRVLKEGVSEDQENKARLLPLLFFQSSHDPDALTSLTEYVNRMKEGQQEIWYMCGENRAALERSPHLEEFKARGFEILYLTDPVDELLVQAIGRFAERPLRSASHGILQADGDATHPGDAEAFAELTDWLCTRLDAKVRAVRLSGRLTSSPACLVGDHGDFGPRIERVLLQKPGAPAFRKRVLELNPKHHLVQGMRDRLRVNPLDPVLETAADMLFGLAVLAEGSELPDPVTFTSGLTGLLSRVLHTEQAEGSASSTQN